MGKCSYSDTKFALLALLCRKLWPGLMRSCINTSPSAEFIFKAAECSSSVTFCLCPSQHLDKRLYFSVENWDPERTCNPTRWLWHGREWGQWKPDIHQVRVKGFAETTSKVRARDSATWDGEVRKKTFSKMKEKVELQFLAQWISSNHSRPIGLLLVWAGSLTQQ